MRYLNEGNEGGKRGFEAAKTRRPHFPDGKGEERGKKGKEVLKVSPKLGRHAVGRPSKGKKEKC